MIHFKRSYKHAFFVTVVLCLLLTLAFPSAISYAADIQAPTAPTNLHVSSQTSTSVTLSWTASTDDIAVTSYEIFNGATLAGTATTTTFNLSNLSSNSSYTFIVKAKDAAGNTSPSSNPISITLTPFEIIDLTFTSSSTTQNVVNITLGGTPFYVEAYQNETAVQFANRIRDTLSDFFTGWSVSGDAGSPTVRFTAATGGVKDDSSFQGWNTNMTGTVTVVQKGSIYEIIDLTFTSSSTAQDVVNITLGGTPFYVGTYLNETAIQFADRIRDTLSDFFTGWSVSGSAGSPTVRFTATTEGSKDDSSFQGWNTNMTGTVTVVQKGSNSPGTGLKGEYYGNMDLTGLKMLRVDANIDFDWGMGAPVSSMDSDHFSVRWTGHIEPKYSEDYTFYTYSDDGARVWVNGQLIINEWYTHGALEFASTPITLHAGQAYDIKVEYFEDDNSAIAALLWSSASQLKEAVPQNRLYPPPDAPFDKPGTPTNIAITPESTSATLTWDAVNTAASYEVEWDGEVVPLDNKQIFFKRKGLQPGSQHTYRVRALNAYGASDWGVLGTVLTNSNLPLVPIDLTPAYTDTTVRLNWSETTDASEYEVEADGLVVSTGDANYTEISGLKPGTSHTFRVRGINAIGSGAWSSSSTLITHTLSTPTNIKDTADVQAITLTWNAVTDATGYQIEVDGTVFWTSANTYTKNGLNAETFYKFRVKAIGSGDSAWSEVYRVSTLPSKPGTPLKLNAVAAKNAVTIFWDEVPDSIGYDVELDGIVVVDNFTATTYTDIELTPFTQHTYRVRAKNNAIEGDWSPLVTLYTLPDKPGVPSNIVITSAGSIATITWNADPTALGYDIEVDGLTIDVGTKTEYKHRRLKVGSEHSYRLRIRNAAGTGEWSGKIINNALVAKLTKNKSVDLGLTASDVVDFSKYTMTVTYDAKAIDVINLSTLSPEPILTTGRIKDTDITITEFTPGKITFVCDKVVQPGESWTGVINSIKFKARVSGGSPMTYSVFIKPPVTNAP
jgi:hypothetical protein